MISMSDDVEVQDKNGLIGSTREINASLKEMAKRSNRIQISGLNGQDSIAVGWNENIEIQISGNSGYYLGAFNRKAVITLNGNTGDQAGNSMSGGGLVILGNCGKHCGTKMRNGVIVVKGNAGDDIGRSMYNGTILVDGDAEGDVGFGSVGGTIIITGNVKGNIYCKGTGQTIFIGGDHFEPRGGKKVSLNKNDLKVLDKYFQHYAVKAKPGMFSKNIYNGSSKVI